MSHLDDTVLNASEGNLDQTMDFNLDQPVRQVGHLGQTVLHVARPGSVASRDSKHKSLALLKAKIRQAEVKKEYELLKAENEVKLAELELEVDDESASCVKVDSDVKVRQYLEDCARVPTNVEQPRLPSSSYTMKVDLPKVELESFHGDPRCYWRFIQQFRYYVEDRVQDVGQRLLYLQHYCKGQAKEAIAECIMLPPEAGYARAREILKDLFGREHIVAKALLDDLLRRLKPTHDDSASLSNLSMRMENCQIALGQMGYVSDLNSITTMERIVRSLHRDARGRWARFVDESANRGHQATFFDLCQFVASEARVARSRFGQLVGPEDHGPARTSRNAMERTFPQRSSFVTQSRGITNFCLFCKGNHSLSGCSAFSVLNLRSKWEFVSRKKVCYLCLCSGHMVRDCKLTNVCGDDCDKRHHKLLHDSNEHLVNANCNKATRVDNSVCLGVVPVLVAGPKGCLCTYALLDNGSDVTLVEQSVVDEVGLSRQDCTLDLNTVNGCKHITTSKADLTILSVNGGKSIVAEGAYCLPSLAVGSPVEDIGQVAAQWPHLSGLPFNDLADKRVRLLIGTDVPDAHWPIEKKIGRSKEPFAIKTIFGWIVLGPLSAGRNSFRETHFNKEESDIGSHLKALYDTEFHDLESPCNTYSVSDVVALNVAQGSINLKDGHYEIALPWRDADRMPNNFTHAYRRLQSLEKRFTKNPNLFARYAEVMKDMLAKGYASPVPERELNPAYKPRWYLPHHPVINPRKPNKLRIVMDCAARFNGVSLNDRLHQGPDTTASLVGVLLRFRMEPVAIAADIEEMFMQVKVPVRDRGALRFLWWKSNDMRNAPTEYQMTVHPFGATSSPFCANFALKQTALDNDENLLPEVLSAVEKNFYVDDCLVSLPDNQIAQTFVKQLSCMVQRGGFHLRKWLTNEPSVLHDLPELDLVKSTLLIDAPNNMTEKTLGLEWDPNLDVFKFTYVPPERPVTKRGILSAVSSLFDPLGFMSPLLLPAKLLLQKLCKRKAGWDEELSTTEQSEWAKWLSNMRNIGEARVPRCMKPQELRSLQPELHVFSDASEVGYGVVVYVRWLVNMDEYEIRMIYSKSRVAPLKVVTLPRLELNAARLAARVAADIRHELQASQWSITYWTDSMLVLHYIRNVETRFSTFIANRISTIHQLTLPSQWRFVNGPCNPADLTSRGTFSTSILFDWWYGPKFLKSNEKCWPVEASYQAEPEGIELKRKPVSVNTISTSASQQVNGLIRLVNKCSQWFQLLRYLVWLSRFKTYLRLTKYPNVNIVLQTGRVKCHELRMVEMDLIFITQREAYPNIFQKLDAKGSLKGSDLRGSALQKLTPIIINGVMRVGGRLENAPWPHISKHPIILPGKHHVTRLLIRHTHESYGHAGVSHTLALLRERFWIVRGTAAVKKLVHECWTCRKNTAVTCQQIMAPLPIDRVHEGWHPFDIVGVDYFGPLQVRNGRKNEKRYGCLFTCLQTRAVHLEMAYTLSADSFISVLIRFIARRGAPSKFISDNGSNFVGAESELRQLAANPRKDNVSHMLLKREVEWQFHPPLSSHRGGIWERLIRSIRRILRSTVNEQKLTDEKLCTFLTEAERILNSRPIVPWSQLDTERPALTPNDLLILNKRLDGVVPPNVSERYIKGWQQVNYLTQVFWKRWTKEYLPLLQCRQKWLSVSRNMSPGDVVLVVSNLMPRERWPIGVIDSTETSIDGMVRSVNVRTRDGILRRDIRKLCLIEGCE